MSSSSTPRDQTKPCCPGVIPLDYKSLGREETLEGNLPVYINDSNVISNRAILLNYDIFGFYGGGLRAFCDKLASAGFLVIMPDFFRGKPWPMDQFPFPDPAKFMEWMQPFASDKLAADVEVARAYLLTRNITSIGVLGFCWGGKVAVTASATGFYKASVLCHGTFVEDSDGEGIQCPTLFLDAGNDPARDGIMMHLSTKAFAAECETFKYDNMEHGWTIRGDSKDAEVKKCMDEAYLKTEQFFIKNL